MASPAPTRRYSRNPRRHLEMHLDAIYQSVFPSVVAIESHFVGPENRDLKHPVRHNTGVFVGPTTIVTSANVVGRVLTDKPAGAAAAVHRSYIAHNFAITRGSIHRPLKTKVLAVSFAHDVAVLEVVDDAPPEGTSFTPCSIAKSPPQPGDVLLAAVHMVNMQFGMMPGHVRAVGEKTFKVRAPWPLENGSGWVEFDNSQFNGGFPRPWSDLFKSEEEITGRNTIMTGSPLFNSDGELFGVSSWDVSEKGSSRPVSFATSLLPIMVALEYAKNKNPDHDPVVMDTWIQG
ncbi:hypothetical protein ABFS83_10G054400 [Erythranthe nasuta]